MKLILILALFLGGCSHIDLDFSEDKDWDDIKLEMELEEIKG